MQALLDKHRPAVAEKAKPQQQKQCLTYRADKKGANTNGTSGKTESTIEPSSKSKVVRPATRQIVRQ